MTAGSATKGPDRERRDTGSPNSDLPTFLTTWPTPQVHNATGGKTAAQIETMRAATGAGVRNLNETAENWPTPTTRDYKDTGNLENVPENGLLGRVAANWITPSAGDGQRGGSITEAMTGTSLAQQVNSLWSTPRSSDGEKGSPNQAFGAGGIPLAAQANQWPTPTSLNFDQSHQPGNSYSYNKTMELAETVSLRSILPDHPISTVGEESSHIRRTLNPLFVEWLMGWPRGWTFLALTPPASNDCGCSATGLSAWKLRMRSALSSLGLPPPGPPVQHSLFG